MLLPYASDRPPSSPPIVTLSIVLLSYAVLGAVAIAAQLVGPEMPVVWYATLGLAPSVTSVWSFVSYAFLHDDVFHLSLNMLFLWVFGGPVELALGKLRFVGLFVGAAAITGMFEVLMVRMAPGADRGALIIGASGAISAIIGVFAVRFYRSRIRLVGVPGELPAVILLAAVLLGEMGLTVWHLLGRGGGQTTAHWAHISGFVLGLVWAQATRQHETGRREYVGADADSDLRGGSPLAAAERWEEALRENPADPGAHAALARALARAGEADASRTHFLDAISGFLRAGNKRDAVAAYRDLLDSQPDAILSAPDHLAVATALDEQGDAQGALEALEALATRTPASGETEMAQLRICAILLRKLGQRDAAVASLTAFVRRHPDSEFRDYAERMLREADAARGR